MSVPKLHPTVRYAEPDYWDSRYEREPSLFEWFFGHTALRRIIRAYVSKKKTVLQVGCGTSNMQEGMAKSGYTVINTDISPVVIEQMQKRHAQYPNLTYLVSDCRNMPEFRDCQFGHVIDKGTMDALLCSKQGTDNVLAMLGEIYRVLQPGGSFLLVTLGDPTRRLPLLFHPKLQWKVNLLLLPKISGAAQAFVDGKPINDTIKPIGADGPYEVLDANTIVGLPPDVQYSKYFFAYVCKKQGLQLAGPQGQRVQLPANWVAGSKEVFQKLQKELGLPEDLLDKGRRKRIMHVPAGSKFALPTSGSANSSSSSNAAAAAVLGVPVDIERILQEDQMHCQELTASAPSVAGGQGSHGGQVECTPQHQQQQQQLQEQQPLEQQQQQQPAAVSAEAKLDALLHRPEQDQQQDAASKGAIDSGPASPASVPDLTQMERPNGGLDLRALMGSSVASRLSNNNDALTAHLADAASGGMAGGAVSSRPAAEAPATAEQMQQQQLQQYVASNALLDHSCAAVPEIAPAGAYGDSAGLYGSLLSGPAQDQAPGWSMAPAAPRAPRSLRSGVPKIRRFSTESTTQSFSALQPQLAVLRQQQAQHSERAADGLVMHDVPATEAFGSTAMSAAALAGAVWGHTRPPRNRRFSNISTMSGLSVLSSASTGNTDDEEDAVGSGAEENISSVCTTGDSHVQASQSAAQPWQQQGQAHDQQQDAGSISDSDKGEGHHAQQQGCAEPGQQQEQQVQGCTGGGDRSVNSSSSSTTTSSGSGSRKSSPVGDASACQQDCSGGGGPQLQSVQTSDDTVQASDAAGVKELRQRIAALGVSGTPVYANGVVSSSKVGSRSSTELLPAPQQQTIEEVQRQQ